MVQAKGSRQHPTGQAKQGLMVDASALMALFNPDDQYHLQAVAFRNNFIFRYQVQLFTTNYIHSEAMSHLTHLGSDVLKRIDSLIRKPPVRDLLKMKQLLIRKATVQKAMSIYFKYLDHDFSITDCTTFVLMEEHDIHAAFTFDDDFKIYTYQKGHDPQKRGFWKLPEMLKSYTTTYPAYVIKR